MVGMGAPQSRSTPGAGEFGAAGGRGRLAAADRRKGAEGLVRCTGGRSLLKRHNQRCELRVKVREANGDKNVGPGLRAERGLCAELVDPLAHAREVGVAK